MDEGFSRLFDCRVHLALSSALIRTPVCCCILTWTQYGGHCTMSVLVHWAPISCHCKNCIFLGRLYNIVIIISRDWQGLCLWYVGSKYQRAGCIVCKLREGCMHVKDCGIDRLCCRLSLLFCFFNFLNVSLSDIAPMETKVCRTIADMSVLVLIDVLVTGGKLVMWALSASSCWLALRSISGGSLV